MSQYDEILAMLDDGPVTAFDVATELGISESAAGMRLGNMVRAGHLRQVGKVPATADVLRWVALYDRAEVTC